MCSTKVDYNNQMCSVDYRLSNEDVYRLKEYVEKSRNFNLEEWRSEDIDDFVNLADRVVKLRSEDEGAWTMLMLAQTIKALKLVI